MKSRLATSIFGLVSLISVSPYASAKILVTKQGSPNNSARQVQAQLMFDQAVCYLGRSPLAAGIIEHLERSQTEYTVEVLQAPSEAAAYHPSEFDPARNCIEWDASAGLEWKANAFSWKSHSAAIALMHELGHAYHKDVNARAYYRRAQSMTRDQWGNREEKRTILDVENPVARALGEPERNFHEDTGYHEAQRYEALGPTSRLHARMNGPQFKTLF